MCAACPFGSNASNSRWRTWGRGSTGFTGNRRRWIVNGYGGGNDAAAHVAAETA